MTRKWNAHDTQSGFQGWIRRNPRLDSIKDGIVFSDCDMWVHRYKTLEDRDFQFLMLVEFKEFARSLTPSQRDTLHIANQLLRNRKVKKAYQPGDGDKPRIQKAYSILAKRSVNVACYGVHSVCIDGDGMNADRCAITWDGKYEIDTFTLEQLLRFELDPDDMSPLDHRPCGPGSRHKVEEVVKTQYINGVPIETIVLRRS